MLKRSPDSASGPAPAQISSITWLDTELIHPLGLNLAVHLTLGQIPPQGDTGPYDPNQQHHLDAVGRCVVNSPCSSRTPRLQLQVIFGIF